MRYIRDTATLVALLALAAPRAVVAQAEARVVRPDEPGESRSFRRDTLVQRVELRGGTVEVLAERDSASATTTGRYVVRWNGLQVSVRDDAAADGADLPVVAAVAPGSPTVVVLSTRTDLKVIVLEPAPRALGGVAPRVFSVAGVVKGDGDAVRVVGAPEGGTFTLETAGVTLRYADRALRVDPQAAGPRAGGPALPPGESAHVAAMKADLRNLVTAQEAFFAEHVKYADRIQLLKFRPARGNRLIRLRATADGWNALIGHEDTRTVCAVFIGSTAAAPATTEAEPACI